MEVRLGGTHTRRCSPTTMLSSASAMPGNAVGRHCPCGSSQVRELDKNDPSFFQAVKCIFTQSLPRGCSFPRPGWSTFIARPDGVLVASGGGAATSEGGGNGPAARAGPERSQRTSAVLVI